MPDIIAHQIEAYAQAQSSPPPSHLVALAEETTATLDAPGMMVGALEGRLLEFLVFATGAEAILEIGTFSGYSSLSMACALVPSGHIVTCEIQPRHAEVARRHIDTSLHGGQIEVLVGPALESIAHLDGPFDLVFIDADKGSYIDYYEAVLPKLAPRGLLVADNTLWSGRVIDADDTSPDTVAIRAFNDHVAADERVVQVMLTVRDGVTLVRRAD